MTNLIVHWYWNNNNRFVDIINSDNKKLLLTIDVLYLEEISKCGYNHDDPYELVTYCCSNGDLEFDEDIESMHIIKSGE